tara:strand:+ start:51 stop:824 length:774 start_codon:yes stop_codon:yes gene_type:complete
MQSEINNLSKKLARAFNNNTLIAPLPKKFCTNTKNANLLRIASEKLIKSPIIGFKAGATGKVMLKKWKEKEPFYASIFKKNLVKTNSKVALSKNTFGIELEVFYFLDKKIFKSKNKITTKNIVKYIHGMGPCIELVGYRQRKKGVKCLGDLTADFGCNVKFIIGKKKKFKNLKFNNLATKLYNKKSGQIVEGNTKVVYDSPIKSCVWLINKARKDKVYINKNFYVFTGSTVGVVPIQKKGTFEGQIKSIGTVKATVR